MSEVEQILALFAALPNGEPALLATVVDVEGSAYRRPGARLLIARDGRRAGSISGGCLERDLARRGSQLAALGPRVVVYDTRGDEERPAGEFNTGCDGVVKVLLEQVIGGERAPAVAHLRGGGATRYTVFASGGNCPSLNLCDRPASLPVEPKLAATTTLRLEWPRGAWADVLVEPGANRSPRLDIFGSGNDVVPLVDIAAAVGWRVRVIGTEPREQLRERFGRPGVGTRTWRRGERRSIPCVSGSAVVLATHSYDQDFELLPAVLHGGPRYVGLLGPKRRVARLMRELHERRHLPPPERLAVLRTPAGLDLGGDAPGSVALSIVSEIHAVLHERSGEPLHGRAGSIHATHPRITVRVPQT